MTGLDDSSLPPFLTTKTGSAHQLECEHVAALLTSVHIGFQANLLCGDYFKGSSDAAASVKSMTSVVNWFLRHPKALALLQGSMAKPKALILPVKTRWGSYVSPRLHVLVPVKRGVALMCQPNRLQIGLMVHLLAEVSALDGPDPCVLVKHRFLQAGHDRAARIATEANAAC